MARKYGEAVKDKGRECTNLGKVGFETGKATFFPEKLDIVSQFGLTDLCQQFSRRLSLQPSNQFPFDKLGKSFVEPEMLLHLAISKVYI